MKRPVVILDFGGLCNIANCIDVDCDECEYYEFSFSDEENHKLNQVFKDTVKEILDEKTKTNQKN